MAKSKRITYWWEFFLLRQKKVYLVSPITFLLSKFLFVNNTIRLWQGIKDGVVTQLHRIKMVIHTAALPAGNRNTGGTFNNIGTNVNYWSATENSASNAWNRNLNTGNAQSNRNNNNKAYGFTARCLQDWQKPASLFGRFYNKVIV